MKRKEFDSPYTVEEKKVIREKLLNDIPSDMTNEIMESMFGEKRMSLALWGYLYSVISLKVEKDNSFQSSFDYLKSQEFIKRINWFGTVNPVLTYDKKTGKPHLPPSILADNLEVLRLKLIDNGNNYPNGYHGMRVIEFKAKEMGLYMKLSTFKKLKELTIDLESENGIGLICPIAGPLLFQYSSTLYTEVDHEPLIPFQSSNTLKTLRLNYFTNFCRADYDWNMVHDLRKLVALESFELTDMKQYNHHSVHRGMINPGQQLFLLPSCAFGDIPKISLFIGCLASQSTSWDPINIPVDIVKCLTFKRVEIGVVGGVSRYSHDIYKCETLVLKNVVAYVDHNRIQLYEYKPEKGRPEKIFDPSTNWKVIDHLIVKNVWFEEIIANDHGVFCSHKIRHIECLDLPEITSYELMDKDIVPNHKSKMSSITSFNHFILKKLKELNGLMLITCFKGVLHQVVIDNAYMVGVKINEKEFDINVTHRPIPEYRPKTGRPYGGYGLPKDFGTHRDIETKIEKPSNLVVQEDKLSGITNLFENNDFIDTARMFLGDE